MLLSQLSFYDVTELTSFFGTALIPDRSLQRVFGTQMIELGLGCGCIKHLAKIPIINY